MKKLLLVLAIGAFVACNDNSESTEVTADTAAAVTVDTAAVAPVDTTVVVDTTAAAATADTSAKK